MKDLETSNQTAIDALYEKLSREAEAGGYHLNPDCQFSKELVKGLLVNEKRYGYWACPCRLASGIKNEDTDIICPCDYRDADVTEYGTCYCALYVSSAVKEGTQHVRPIPERRPPRPQRAQFQKTTGKKVRLGFSVSKPIWRCTVCGYLCARDNPPELCPICKAKKERFEQFV